MEKDWKSGGTSSQKRNGLFLLGLGNNLLNFCLILKIVSLKFSEKDECLHRCLLLVIIWWHILKTYIEFQTNGSNQLTFFFNLTISKHWKCLGTQTLLSWCFRVNWLLCRHHSDSTMTKSSLKYKKAPVCLRQHETSKYIFNSWECFSACNYDLSMNLLIQEYHNESESL